MKLTVDIYMPNTQGEVEKAGELRFDGETITASDPDRMLLKNIMAEPLRWPGLDAPIDPREKPELFMRNLHRMYRSPYLTCLRAVEG